MTIKLALFGLITSFCVGVVYVVTAPFIVESKEAARLHQLYELALPLLETGVIGVPVAVNLPDNSPAALANPLIVTPITDTKGLIGTIFSFETSEGYGGRIQLLIALDRERRIIGVRANDHKETPGLGDKIEVRRSDWILGFNQLKYSDMEQAAWAVKKDGGRFDVFTGATITPRAVVNALGDTLEFLENHPSVLEVGP